MKFYKIDDQIVLSDKELTVGTELVPNTTDAAGEKHVPVITKNNDEVTVKVGSVEHPSLDAPLHRVHRPDHRNRLPDEMAEAGRHSQSHFQTCGRREPRRRLRILQPAWTVDGEGISTSTFRERTDEDG